MHIVPCGVQVPLFLAPMNIYYCRVRRKQDYALELDVSGCSGDYRRPNVGS